MPYLWYTKGAVRMYGWKTITLLGCNFLKLSVILIGGTWLSNRYIIMKLGLSMRYVRLHVMLYAWKQ